MPWSQLYFFNLNFPPSCLPQGHGLNSTHLKFPPLAFGKAMVLILFLYLKYRPPPFNNTMVSTLFKFPSPIFHNAMVSTLLLYFNFLPSRLPQCYGLTSTLLFQFYPLLLLMISWSRLFLYIKISPLMSRSRSRLYFFV